MLIKQNKYFSPFLLMALVWFTLSSKAFCQTPETINIDFNQIEDAPGIGTLNQLLPYYNLEFKIIDVNNDNNYDIISYMGKEEKNFSIRTQDNRVIKEIPLKKPIDGKFQVLDIDNDNFYELIFLSHTNDTAYLNIHSINSNDYKKIKICTGKDISCDGKWDISLNDTKLLDHSNGNKYLILSLSTGYDGSPRGIYALNLSTYKIDWKFKLGSRPFGDILVYDINNDQQKEILFSTFSSSNGFEINGYSDTLSYFFILDENGKELYHKTVSGKFSYSFFKVSALSNNIFIHGYSKDFLSDQPYFFVIHNGKIDSVETIQISNLTNIRIINFPNNSLVSTHQPICFWYKEKADLHIFNKDYSEKAVINFPFIIEYILTGDFNGDGEPNYFVVLKSIYKNSLLGIILDNKFNILAKQNFSSSSISAPIYNSTQGKSIFHYLNNETHLIMEWSLPKNQLVTKFGFVYYWNKVKYILPWVLSLILFGLVFVLYYKIHNKRSQRINKLNELSKYLMDNPKDAILIINENTIIETFNDAFEKLFNIPKGNKKIKTNYLSFLKDNGISNATLHAAIGNSLNPADKPYYYAKNSDVSINDKLHKLSIKIQKVILDKDHFLIIVKFNDLTEFTKSDRVANWAAVAQKLAHEIKNPLMSMGLSLGQLEKKTTSNDKDANAKYFDYIKEDIERMRDSANHFFKFTSSLDFQYSTVNINDVLNELITSYNQIVSERIKFNPYFDTTIPDVKIDVEQTKQVLINIIDNAIDAIKNKGTIIVKTLTTEKIEKITGKVKKYIQIEISDDGIGISIENISKIFEPNFTTKATGSGFGMAIAKHIIEEQKGTIKISSKLDVGTTVTIELLSSNENIN